jgi:hypothetical protein
MHIPLHLPREGVGSVDALARVELHTAMAMLMRGKGFRQPGKNSQPTRIERIAESYYGTK